MTNREFISLPDELFVRIAKEWIGRAYEDCDYTCDVIRDRNRGRVKIVCVSDDMVLRLYPYYNRITAISEGDSTWELVNKYQFVKWTHKIINEYLKHKL